ncbi:MAG TPA: hypothetical protein VFR87_03090 [Nocardioidaceae bacterium]|nr:hypothetical protein [Nocardioidaceae bacterium]
MSQGGAQRTAPVVLLHIGAMKTGTTYLQQVMIRNKDVLASHGLLFPGESWSDQVRAAHDLVGHHRERGVRQRAAGAWDAVTAEMLAWDGAASVLSVEFLSFAGPRVAQRAVESLAGAEVHVVLTVRDTAEVLPGLWQTHCANGGTASWPGFARSARFGAGIGPLSQPLGQGARLFRRALDVPRMLDVWAPVVPAQRLHVVTVPRPGAPRELLWERFASVLGVDPAVATRPAAGHNPSLGYASADLMRRLNSELGRLPRHRYNPTLKHYLAERVLAERRTVEARAELDAASAEFTARWNRRVRTALEASTAHLVGDLEDLPVTEPETPAGPIVEPTQADLLDAAEAAAEGLDRLVRRRARRLERRGEDVSDVAVPADGGRRSRWETSGGPVTAAVDDLAELTRAAVTLHERLTRRKH